VPYPYTANTASVYPYTAYIALVNPSIADTANTPLVFPYTAYIDRVYSYTAVPLIPPISLIYTRVGFSIKYVFIERNEFAAELNSPSYGKSTHPILIHGIV
jgi:hypothetical protein